jgi:hypothetical protein
MLIAPPFQPCMHSVETDVPSMSVRGEPFPVKSRLVRTTRRGVSPQAGVNLSVRGEPSDPQTRPSVRTAGEASDPIFRGPVVMHSCVPCPRHPSNIAAHLQPTSAMCKARRRQREVSQAVQTRSSLTSTIMHLTSRSRSSSLALYCTLCSYTPDCTRQNA